MLIGIPQETTPGETRVAATPSTVTTLIKLGHDVIIESGAGERADICDDAYLEAGAHIGDTATTWAADIIAKINPPNDEELDNIRDGATLISLLNPRTDPAMVDKLATRNITALAMDAVPRISRAQSMDVLSSMANIAGYRAVIEAAHEFGRFLTGQVTAAGKVPPAKIFIAGAGVAGLAAIGTAGSLGAIVRATDTRPEVAEQVQSMGAEFVAVNTNEETTSTDGYARETSSAYETAAAAMYAEQAKDVDIIITTALIPGRPAPRLITADMVNSMKPGSVIVDMAAANGGNVEGVIPGEKTTTSNGVTIIGYTDLAGRLPTQASQLYGTNIVNLLKLLTPHKDGHLALDMDDSVIRGMTVIHNGNLMWPP
ncbi:Re/Si-specific NAD(P)(+) transhydrogenase subunit alpha, partial [Dermatophilus congolensis]